MIRRRCYYSAHRLLSNVNKQWIHKNKHINSNCNYVTSLIRSSSCILSDINQHRLLHPPKSSSFTTRFLSTNTTTSEPNDSRLSHLESTTNKLLFHPPGSLPSNETIQIIDNLHTYFHQQHQSPETQQLIATLSTKLLLRLFSEIDHCSDNNNRQNSSSILKTTHPIHSTLECLSLSHHSPSSSGKDAKLILEKWFDLFGTDFELQPDTKGFEMVLQSFENSSSSTTTQSFSFLSGEEAWENALMAEECLKSMTLLYKSGNIYVKPSKKSLGCVIMCWCGAAKSSVFEQERVREAADKAGMLLHEMKTVDDDGNYVEMMKYYHAVIEAWLEVNGDDGYQNATRLLYEMETEIPNLMLLQQDGNVIRNLYYRIMTKTNDVKEQESLLHRLLCNFKEQVDMKHYWVLISSYCSMQPTTVITINDDNDSDDLSHKIQSTLHFMEQCLTKPISSKRYLNLIKSTPSPAIAEILLHHMLHLYTNKHLLKEPDPREINAAFHSIMKRTSSFSKLQSLLHIMDDCPIVQPNTTTYNFLLSKCQNSITCQRLLTKMEQLEQTQPYIKPNAISYTQVIHTLAKQKHAQEAQSILDKLTKRYIDSNYNDNYKPDVTSYACTLLAFAKNGDIDHTTSLLRKMWNGDGTIIPKPNNHIYAIVLNAFSKKGMAMKAHDYLEEMERRNDPPPNNVCYSVVITAWSRSGNNEYSAQMAESLLRQLEQKYNETRDETMKPNTWAMSAVIDAWAKSGTRRIGANKAESMLNEMERLYRSGANTDVKPNVFAYTSVIQAYAHSYQPHMAQNAYRIYRTLMSSYYQNEGDERMKPDPHTYTALLNAFANTARIGNVSVNEKRRALQLCIKVFSELKSSKSTIGDNLNSIHYGVLIKACSRLASDERDKLKLLEQVFRECKKDGMVNDGVMKQLRMGVNDEIVVRERFLEGLDVTSGVDGLPDVWRRNALERRGRRTRRSR